MSASTDLVIAAQKRLRDLEEERAELLSLLRRHGALPDDLQNYSAPEPQVAKQDQPTKASRLTKKGKGKGKGRRVGAATTMKHGVTLAQQRGMKAFQKLEGGPTDVVLEVLRGASEGLSYKEVVDGALPKVNTNATNPRRSIGNTLIALRKNNKVAYHDGKYYAPLAG